MSKGFKQKLLSTLKITEEDFLNTYDIDLRYIPRPAYIGPPLKLLPDGSKEDIWGIPRKMIKLEIDGSEEFYNEVVNSPLVRAKTVEEINNYAHWPSHN